MTNSTFNRYLPIIVALVIGVLIGYHARYISESSTVISLKTSTINSNKTTHNSGLQNDIAETSVVELTNPFGAVSELEPAISSHAVQDEPSATLIAPAQSSEGFVVATISQEVIDQLRELAELNGHSAYVEEYAAKELNVVQLLRQSPELVDQYLALYVDTVDEALGNTILSLLAASGSPSVESYALENIGLADSASDDKWIKLLAAVGVNSKVNREQLLNVMDYVQEPKFISTAIAAFSPQAVPVDEQAAIIQRLSLYTSSDDELVRAASIETLSGWPGEDHTHLLELGLSDESEHVRNRAVYAATYSGAKSEVIKSQLLEILSNDGEDPALRIDAHEALTNYSLSDDEKEKLYEFFLEFMNPDNPSESAMG